MYAYVLYICIYIKTTFWIRVHWTIRNAGENTRNKVTLEMTKKLWCLFLQNFWMIYIGFSARGRLRARGNEVLTIKHKFRFLRKFPNFLSFEVRRLRRQLMGQIVLNLFHASVYFWQIKSIFKIFSSTILWPRLQFF